MKHLTIGIFHDVELGKQLGKKGTQSDIILYNRKTDDAIYSFMQPVDDKFSVKTQIISEIDAAIISFEKLTKQTAETIVLLDSCQIRNGIIITNPYDDEEKIQSIIKNTILQSYHILDKDHIKIFKTLQEFHVQKKLDMDPIILIDHSFSVKGVGEVLLGVVKQGTIKKHDSLYLMPQKKNIVIRSIQMQDKDVDRAEAGSRIGCAIKGAKADEMKRGSIICTGSVVKIDNKLSVSFKKNPYYDELTDGIYHLSLGMQTVPVAISKSNDDKLTIKTEKDIVFTNGDICILLDLNAKKSRVIGTAIIK